MGIAMNVLETLALIFAFAVGLLVLAALAVQQEQITALPAVALA